MGPLIQTWHHLNEGVSSGKGLAQTLDHLWRGQGVRETLDAADHLRGFNETITAPADLFTVFLGPYDFEDLRLTFHHLR